MYAATACLDRLSRKNNRSGKMFETAAKVAVSSGRNCAAPADVVLVAFDINPRS